MVRLYHLLGTAEEVEVIASEIYDCLAERLAGDPRASDVVATFRRLADEERQHRLRIKSLASVYRREPVRTEVSDCDTGDLGTLLDESRTLFETVSHLANPLQLHEAVRLALAMERRFAIVHAHVLAEQAWPAMKGLFEALAAQDRAHAQLLERAFGEIEGRSIDSGGGSLR